MMTSEISVAYDAVMQTGECPLWHPQEQAVYWVDIPAFTVHRLDPATGAHRAWKLDSEPATLALCQRGGLIVAMRSGFAHLDTASAEVRLTPIAAAPYDTRIARFNDGHVDGAGRFWVGTIYEPRDKPAAEMYVLEKGALRLAWSGGVTNSNGLGFSPDYRSLYHADTSAHRVSRYDFNLQSGTVSNQRTLMQFSADKANNYGGRPDGAAVDSAGNYWVAMFEGARLVKLSPEGTLLGELALPVRCPTMLAFGDADLRTLYITSAGARPADELAAYPLSGKLLRVRVDVAGRTEVPYLE
ncbi:SMP-30/gluconolactonase/LRE family protein [Duganella qianjiadongensis]|uniref:SMP-30/gluconolactonase/LRE family protein n=1 Tax=Duganella qianjiadongensis TaxID=2692176 RepID=A0ABW9VGW3_9BURK|nr:SMP-30/gluconolactonase/LRE family protein [Duganella qianjiadongensis]MYM38382.1 SMP-30/gluconolactonase/LRE family protein [Duganella qianjiadongensis]